jgi:hypothetical protein
MKGCLLGAAATTLLCAALVAVAQWLAPSLLPQLHVLGGQLANGGSQIRLRTAWPIQRGLLQAVRRAATAKGGIFLAVRPPYAEQLKPLAGLSPNPVFQHANFLITALHGR